MQDLIFKEEAYAIMGACFEVYNEMGSGFLEPVYQECLALELAARALPFVPKAESSLHYKDHKLEQVLSA